MTAPHSTRNQLKHLIGRIEALFAEGPSPGCLRLAEATVPAAQHWLRLHLREEVPDLVTRTGLVWRPRQQTVCCPPSGFRDPVKAAEHVRSEAHIATVFGSPRSQLAVVLRQWSGHLQTMSSRRVTWKPGLTPEVVGELQSLIGRPCLQTGVRWR